MHVYHLRLTTPTSGVKMGGHQSSRCRLGFSTTQLVTATRRFGCADFESIGYIGRDSHPVHAIAARKRAKAAPMWPIL